MQRTFPIGLLTCLMGLSAGANAQNSGAETAQPPSLSPPGVVVNHIPASSGMYIGSPSIAVLPNGDYVASHDLFGPKSDYVRSAKSLVFRSCDRGRSWKNVSEIQGALWCSLFVHRDRLYLLGCDRRCGNILIRRSNDGGQTWSSPTSSKTGILRDTVEFHCAPMPVVEHNGRLWRAFEWRHPRAGWAVNYRAGMLSAPVEADLLDASNWTFSEFLPCDRSWNRGDMRGWLEGNAVVTPSGEIVDILRVDTKSSDEKAAVVHISADGKKASFDPATGFVEFPGGAKKFSIRFDPESKLYWSLANVITQRPLPIGPASVRNTLALTCSPDLAHWTVRSVVLSHPEMGRHAFQYVDWLFDDVDLIAVSRTAYDDDLGGAHNYHDANYLTFHRVLKFRDRTTNDAVLRKE